MVDHWKKIFWEITPCGPLKVNRRFVRTYRLHLQGLWVSRARNQRESRWQADAITLAALHFMGNIYGGYEFSVPSPSEINFTIDKDETHKVYLII
jgi:hypothetical protein